MDGDKTVTAVFLPIPSFTLTVSIAGNGSVDPGEGRHTYLEGAEVTLTATPDPGWLFVEWQGDAAGTDNTAMVLMSADKNVTAVFEQM
jgi:hypothetical protein